MELINTDYVIYVRRIRPNMPGPTVLPSGGKLFTHPAKPFMRTAFYGSPDSVVAMAWKDGNLRKDRKTYRLNGVLYQLKFLD